MSLGGAISLRLAIDFPERVTTLQLHGSWAKTHGYARMYLSMLGRFLDEGGLDFYYEAALLYLFPPDFLTENYDLAQEILGAHEGQHVADRRAGRADRCQSDP